MSEIGLQIVLVVYGIVVFAAVARIFLLIWLLRITPMLTPQSPKLATNETTGPVSEPKVSEPIVSVIVPAKDEAATIGQCLQGLLRQTYANVEFWVVDDRSTDGTAAIVQEWQAQDPRLQLLQIEQLPAGWTGKTHALHRVQQLAKGEWFLFVDADTELHPDAVAITLAEAQQQNADLFSLLPSLKLESFWEYVVQPFIGFCYLAMYPLPFVNRTRQPAQAFANGQFILIHRTAYYTIGGHEAVRDKFVEDIHLARRIIEHGLRLWVVLAPDLCKVRMYTNLASIMRGWSRIFYSTADFRPIVMWRAILATLIFSVGAYTALLVGLILLLRDSHCWFGQSLFTLAVIHEGSQLILMAIMYYFARAPFWSLLFRPLAVFISLAILYRAIRLCSTHQLDWRGTVYTQTIQQPNTN